MRLVEIVLERSVLAEGARVDRHEEVADVVRIRCPVCAVANHGDELAVDALRGNSHQVLPGAADRLT